MDFPIQSGRKQSVRWHLISSSEPGEQALSGCGIFGAFAKFKFIYFYNVGICQLVLNSKGIWGALSEPVMLIFRSLSSLLKSAVQSSGHLQHLTPLKEKNKIAVIRYTEISITMHPFFVLAID